ncbi:hypothetical protein PNEG_02591 [Pneumocystis murina B123]|uniref:R3H domain-containing protein n=1 Tax=Pneumocystis murina (strain B123) TaxID=1069680 RepID=M7NPU1_PNEMU|nr:hypothetical protein PNEG_02591 [Pneumocystis murina B123]EMR09257.1 hypothetical protein PNEG_02591 [Pneumocystis murina B123]
MAVTDESSQLEAYDEAEHHKKMNYYQGVKNFSTKRDDISQSRLFNGYSLNHEKDIKELPLLRSFSSPLLWTNNLGKTQASATESLTQASTPMSIQSPDNIFSRRFPFQYTQTSSQQTALHNDAAHFERLKDSHYAFCPQTAPFISVNTMGSSNFQSSTISPSYPYYYSTTQSIPYDNYGYASWRSIPEGKERVTNKWVNNSDTNNSSQNPNVSTTFMPSGTSKANTSDNLQENSFQESTITNLKNTARTEDGVLPSAIVVKNIPFQIKKEQLLELFDTLDIPKPYAFNYHFDNGNFRGLAFANFYTPEETTRVILSLNGHDIMGRKLRVEYKRILPIADREKANREKKEKRNQYEEQHNSSNPGFFKGKRKSKDIDLNDEATLKIYSRLLLFRNDQSPNAPNELIFPLDTSLQQRRIIHYIAEKLGLEYTSCGENDAKYIVINRLNSNNTDNIPMNFWNKPNFGISDQSVSPVASLSATNLTSNGLPLTSNFSEKSDMNSRIRSMKPLNDIRTMNTQILSKTNFHQVQPLNAVTNTSFDLGVSNLQNDINVMMQNLNFNVTNKQSKNGEWGSKKGFKNMIMKTNIN